MKIAFSCFLWTSSGQNYTLNFVDSTWKCENRPTSENILLTCWNTILLVLNTCHQELEPISKSLPSHLKNLSRRSLNLPWLETLQKLILCNDFSPIEIQCLLLNLNPAITRKFPCAIIWQHNFKNKHRTWISMTQNNVWLPHVKLLETLTFLVFQLNYIWARQTEHLIKLFVIHVCARVTFWLMNSAALELFKVYQD